MESEELKQQPIPWPTLSNEELAHFYSDIKRTRTLNINWTTPGRLDPKLVLENFEKLKTEKESSELNNENSDDSNLDDSNDPNENQDKDEFDLFDEFKDGNEKMTKDKISELRLKHSSIRDTKKVASVDKILFSIKKNREIESQRLSMDDSSSVTVTEAQQGISGDSLPSPS